LDDVQNFQVLLPMRALMNTRILVHSKIMGLCAIIFVLLKFFVKD
jgi:hypothetical protein